MSEELEDLARRCRKEFWRERPPSEEEIDFLKRRYAEGILWADAALGRLFAFLEATGLLENTVVLITSDHGEEFFEHGRVGHSASLYREVLWIPAILRAPGLAAARVGAPVGLVDMAPTLLDLTGHGIPAEMQGRSLVPLAVGISAGPRTALSEHTAYNKGLHRSSYLRSLIDGRHHLILTTDEPRTRDDETRAKLFDLIEDPSENENLAGRRPDLVRRLTRELESGLEVTASIAKIAPEPNLEERLRLEALGYLD